MLSPENFYKILIKNDIDFFSGVPDSLLKSICGYISDNTSSNNHIITSNEGGAIGVGIGYHLATNKVPLIYMQNSGLGNAINPLLSLADPDVYSIPMLLLIGWRGMPGVKDEPQHVKQGRIMIPLLESMEIPYAILPDDDDDLDNCIINSLKIAKKKSSPFVLIAKKNHFHPYDYSLNDNNNLKMTREEALKIIINNLSDSDLIVSTTGMASREIFEYREEINKSHNNDFLTVGGMGHASQIALGISNQCLDRQVICIDGDGAAIMHFGSLIINATESSKNFKHIIINNGSHDSVGGQLTAGFKVDITKIANNIGYKTLKSSLNEEELSNGIKKLLQLDGPALLEVKVKKGYRKSLGRPTTTPEENKIGFMQNINNTTK